MAGLVLYHVLLAGPYFFRYRWHHRSFSQGKDSYSLFSVYGIAHFRANFFEELVSRDNAFVQKTPSIQLNWTQLPVETIIQSENRAVVFKRSSMSINHANGQKKLVFRFSSKVDVLCRRHCLMCRRGCIAHHLYMWQHTQLYMHVPAK